MVQEKGMMPFYFFDNYLLYFFFKFIKFFFRIFSQYISYIIIYFYNAWQRFLGTFFIFFPKKECIKWMSVGMVLFGCQWVSMGTVVNFFNFFVVFLIKLLHNKKCIVIIIVKIFKEVSSWTKICKITQICHKNQKD